MKEFSEGLLLPAPNAHGRHRQARQIPKNLDKEIEMFWADIKAAGGGEEITPVENDAIKKYIVTRSSPRNFRLVRYMRARIYKTHLDRPRRDFPQRASDARMNELGAKPGDDKGHILAFSLGTYTKCTKI